MAGGGGPIIPDFGEDPIDLGNPYGLGVSRVFIPVANTVLSASPDTSYNTEPFDLRTSTPSGCLMLGDGTFGGVPLAGLNYGIPSAGLIQWSIPLNIEGDSLQAFMTEFPRYTRVHWDKTSLGAQIFTAVSRVTDEVIQAQTMFFRSFTPISFPLYEQGVVYEWNYNEVHNLDTNPAVSGRLGSSWFGIPLVKDEHAFWTTPPTRLETTSNEIDDLTILDWTNVGSSGLVTLISGEISLPLYNQIVVEVSGANTFTFDTDTTTVIGTLFIQGAWAHDSFRHQVLKTEEFSILGNLPQISEKSYRSLNNVEVRGVDPSAYVRIRVLNFNAKWKQDSLIEVWRKERSTQTPDRIFWQLATKDTAFSGIVQPNLRVLPGATDEVYLARTVLLTDTMHDDDIEWNVLEAWKISESDGTALSGIVDIAPVPNTRFLLLLGSDSKVWVIDTYRPAIDMGGFAEATSSPVLIQLSYPKDSSETLGTYTIGIDPSVVSTADGVQRWRWSVHHHGSIDVIPASGTPYPFNHSSGWQTGRDETVVIPSISYVVSGAGQYVFELATMTDNGIGHVTYAGYQQVEKFALGSLPIDGLLYAPSGIEFDSYARPWVAVSGNAVRLIMRTDAGIWVPSERVLLTREDYDETRIF